MVLVDDVTKIDFDSIPIDEQWNLPSTREPRLHRIHAYPAKFPAFIPEMALNYARASGRDVKRVSDIFCGCGTVALEARRQGIDFWGCDLNPVATLIARAKSYDYQLGRITRYFEKTVAEYALQAEKDFLPEEANPRLLYWHSEKSYVKVAKLKAAIDQTVPARSKYRDLFLCMFSNILKPCSRWLTKSIKPQIDPHKVEADAIEQFRMQYEITIKALKEHKPTPEANVTIRTRNCIGAEAVAEPVDLIITSPPYVTSYEYADLHQLSTLWLGFANDYRTLRDGSVGSMYQANEVDLSKLNSTAKVIVSALLDVHPRQARSVAQYYIDMDRVVSTAHAMLSDIGMMVVIIGDTEFRGVRVENARHLSQAMDGAGFKKIRVSKRKITGKFLTPYRTAQGRFTNDQTGRKVYSEEYIVVGEKG